MRKFIGICLVAILLSGCVGTSKETVVAYSNQLTYPERPSAEDAIGPITEEIRPILKDPDSIKRVSIYHMEKCYQYRNNLSGNMSPQYSYGYWCLNVEYYATNSYGGYIPGKAFIIYDGSSYQRMGYSHQTIVAWDQSFVYRLDNPYMQPPG